MAHPKQTQARPDPAIIPEAGPQGGYQEGGSQAGPAQRDALAAAAAAGIGHRDLYPQSPPAHPPEGQSDLPAPGRPAGRNDAGLNDAGKVAPGPPREQLQEHLKPHPTDPAPKDPTET